MTRLADIDAVLDRVPARLDIAGDRHALINIETTLRLAMDLLEREHGVSGAKLRRLQAIGLLLGNIERRRDELSVDEIRGLLADAAGAMLDTAANIETDAGEMHWIRSA